MRGIKALVALAAVAAAIAVPGSAGALSPQDQCTQDGGTFVRLPGGVKSCVTVEVPGKNQGGVTKEHTESQKGSFNSSHPREESNCVNNNGGTHCPGGQN